jgi:hypothetical protein
MNKFTKFFMLIALLFACTNVLNAGNNNDEDEKDKK